MVVENGAVSYHMNLSTGTPPLTFPAIIDTGSDLIWTQCAPCTKCFKQLTLLFEPSMLLFTPRCGPMALRAVAGDNGWSGNSVGVSCGMHDRRGDLQEMVTVSTVASVCGR
ncbi:hypothetical protein E2562_003854 [Oryza meyeriana var. granulata]|uniref:Peptidase A1 domain-containing protein n=1 Tax=Oryza meyeriana var. granulata TaxID=110450 RepID=A0A6G1D0I8_9ORYZ|nr:hypothetical protein E2562_003854 [Oryza meyeriana var. granulata]